MSKQRSQKNIKKSAKTNAKTSRSKNSGLNPKDKKGKKNTSSNRADSLKSKKENTPLVSDERAELSPRDALFVYSVLLSLFIFFAGFTFLVYKFDFTDSMPLGLDSLSVPLLVFSLAFTHFFLRFYESLKIYKKHKEKPQINE